jgi:predicted dehydrogenase
MSERPLRAGLIGASAEGRWGALAHVPALQALPEFELRAVCATRPETALASQRAYGVPLAFHDHRELVAHPEIDVVVIAVRVPHHAELTHAAIAAGKHVVTEWPLATSTEQARGMLQAARAAGVRHAVGLQARTAPAVLAIRELVAGGFVGEPLSVSVRHVAPFAGGGGRTRAGAWAASRAGGATMLTIRAGHDLDMLRFCLGEPTRLSARLRTLRPWLLTDSGEQIPTDVPDSIQVHAELASGATASLHIGGHPGPATGWRMELHGTEGTLVAETPGLVQWAAIGISGARSGEALRALPVPGRHHWVPSNVPPGEAYNTAQLLRRFARVVREGGAMEPDFATALSMHELLDVIQRSSDEARELELG